MTDRVLVLAAHPDDELLGVGGTILRHLELGDTVRVHLEACAELRERDRRLATAHKVAHAAGYRLSVGRSAQLGYTVPSFDELVAEFRPDIVYTHYWADINRDHRLVYEATAVACRPFSSNVREFYVYDTPSSTDWGHERFAPNAFVDVAAQLRAKLDLLAEYDGELRDDPHPRSLSSLEARARAWGGMSGYWAAEAFILVRRRW